MARRKERTSSSSRCITNGEVIKFLQTLPEDHTFGTLQEGEEEKQEFLRQLYLPLHSIFKTSTTKSQANRSRIQKISRLEVLQSLSNRFPQFERDPWEFWERLITSLPPYSEQTIETRAQVFLQGAAQLDCTLWEQRILQRFIAVSAYSLFRRAIPTSGARVLTTNIEKFLVDVGLQNVPNATEIYGKIIRRGQRHTLFCQKLNSIDGDRVDSDDRGEVTEDYGPLFFISIPDTM